MTIINKVVTNQTNISELKGLGQKSEKMLASTGITRVQQIRELGSIPCYVMAKHANKNVSLNLLWALESALTGEHWQHVAKNHRTSLLLALEEYEINFK